MKGSVFVVSFFAAGVLAGIANIIPNFIIEGEFSFYALCALMFCVGISIGSDADSFKKFSMLDRRLMLMPLLTIAGTLAGCAVADFFLNDRSLSECLAIGSGMGYYSLSSIFITEYKGVEPGTVALLANIMREIATLLCAPLLARYFGKLAPISAGGATSMDTTLPIIISSSGNEYAIVSVYHGFVTDFSVPFLVTLFCTI